MLIQIKMQNVPHIDIKEPWLIYMTLIGIEPRIEEKKRSYWIFKRDVYW